MPNIDMQWGNGPLLLQPHITQDMCLFFQQNMQVLPDIGDCNCETMIPHD